jgi:hypothetical protein
MAVIVCDPQHQLLIRFVADLLGQAAGFLGALTPMVWIVEMRAIGMEGTMRTWGRRLWATRVRGKRQQAKQDGRSGDKGKSFCGHHH